MFVWKAVLLLLLTAGRAVAAAPELALSVENGKVSYDRSLPQVYLKFGLRNITVYILSSIPKGSCEFDLVLKHELTHVAVARKVVKRFAREISKALLATLDEGTASPYQIAKMIDRYHRQMIEEKNRQDSLLDAPGSVVYQWEQCLK